MFLYHISQTKNRGYCSVRSAVVVAESAAQARTIYPNDPAKIRYIPDGEHGKYDWVVDPSLVTAEPLGLADAKFTQPEIVCISIKK